MKLGNLQLVRKFKEMVEPEYYIKNGLSPIQAFEQGLMSEEEYIGFIKGNIIKYVVRCDKKGQVLDDINKAMNYLEILKELYENKNKKVDVNE